MYYCIKTYIVTPHQNRLSETVLMRGHNICFRQEIRKIIFELSGALINYYSLTGTSLDADVASS